jgi:hypothetical protein
VPFYGCRLARPETHVAALRHVALDGSDRDSHCAQAAASAASSLRHVTDPRSATWSSVLGSLATVGRTVAVSPSLPAK